MSGRDGEEERVWRLIRRQERGISTSQENGQRIAMSPDARATPPPQPALLIYCEGRPE